MKKSYLKPSIELEVFELVDVLESSDGAGFDAEDLLGQEGL